MRGIVGRVRAARTRLAVVGALCAALLPAGAAQAGTAQAGTAAATTTYTVWQWNVAGHKVNRGSATTGMVEGAVASIVGRNVDFAAFNELCGNQWRALVTQLRAAGWPADSANFGRFEPSRQANSGVCGGEEFGNAIFSKRPLGTADRIQLPDDGTAEKRNMLCAPLQADSGTRFCTTHITVASDADKLRQLAAVQGKLDGWVKAGQTVVLAGDLNVQPHYPSLDTFYSATLNTTVNRNNSGLFREVDDNDSGNCLGYGEWTADDPNVGPSPCGTPRKIDMIFVSEASLAAPGSYSGDSLAISTACDRTTASPDGRCSDHRIVVGTATLR
ncbi:endonuclease/exonuclease/phosphatase family protein [Streptomyces roseicoloratus]|uniref:Endonuclease/exonuclease/phosphatase family protein n=1 Tax=Streptomyces roseicoloratus TaxID=2508722 RepID=A0ABY9RWY9_9ACTN|nr:endonuclease/exonuclease/phosphatase family protein [Streptomyces roseicoloratus]WMX46689.1 endonuclease/exonuclease/phosphatase family protein [Streptomyces roseicoloratus]